VRESPQWNALPTHLKRVRKMVKKWPLDEGADWPVLAPGIGRIYRKGYEAHSKARKNPNAETLHDWRKRVKDLWHALELLRNARPAFFERRVLQAHELADLLGDDHDLAVLNAYLDSENLPVDSEMIRSLKTRITDRRVELQRQAFLRGPMVYDESPKTYMERLEAYWHAWRAEVHARRQPTL
ncbi:MAG TPA: CHAD domain-containing protein, partial [Isosphaeraceae bacterium]|nr:CHAD domain-containing protein [Isosphaeraceae bacterium]